MVALTLYALYLACSVAKYLYLGLFCGNPTFDVDRTKEADEIGNQIKTLQKEIREINRGMEREKKEGGAGDQTGNRDNNSSMGSALMSKHSSKVEELDERLKFNSVM